MSIQARVNYHQRSPHAQAFLFDVNGEIGNIVSPTLIEQEVSVMDQRNETKPLTFEEDGILFLSSPTSVVDFQNETSWETTYDQELETLLKKHLGAREVIVFDHTVRVDTDSAQRKPARNVHNDYSQRSAERRLIDLLGHHKAKTLMSGQYGFVNVWRPIHYTINSSPLGFIRPSSMSQRDWMPIDLIYPDRQGEILGVAHNERHEWFYFSNMTPNELIIFNIYDSTNKPFLAHSALDLVDQVASSHPRQSIESRTLVRYN